MHGTLGTFNINNYKINGPAGHAIKNIQTGTVSASAGGTTATAAINPVLTKNTIVTFDEINWSAVGMNQNCFTSSLTSASITFTRIATTNSAQITFQCIEFNNSKSKQIITGISILTSTTTTNVTINAVNTSKTIISLDFDTSNSATMAPTTNLIYYLNSSSNVTIINPGLIADTASLQVLELN